MLWGHRNDPVNFHRCLQDFDRRLPDLLDALRPSDLLVLTSDHGCDPTTPSTDHSREHALLLVYVEGRNAAGRIHEGEFADVGATVNAWLGGKSPGRRSTGDADRRTVRIDDPELVRREYETDERLAGRIAAYRFAEGPDPREIAFRAVAEVRPRRVLEVGRRSRLDRPSGSSSSSARSVAGRRPVRAHGRAHAGDAASRRVVGDVRELPFEDGEFDCAVAAWMLYHVPRRRPGARASWRACFGPAGGWWPSPMVPVTGRS